MHLPTVPGLPFRWRGAFALRPESQRGSRHHAAEDRRAHQRGRSIRLGAAKAAVVGVLFLDSMKSKNMAGDTMRHNEMGYERREANSKQHLDGFKLAWICFPSN